VNILFNCEEYAPMPSGGIGSVVKIVAEGLAKRGHTVVVSGYYYFQPECESYSVINGVHVYNYSLGYHYSRLKRYFFSALNRIHLAGKLTQYELDYYENKLEGLIRKYNIDVVELTDFYNFNYCNSHLHYHKFGIPVVMRFHGSAYYLLANSGKCNSKVRSNDLQHYSRADYFSYVSHYIREYTRMMGGKYPTDREIIIHNMVEDDFLFENNNPACSKTILFFGKLTRTKGAFSTVRSFNEFHKTHPDWKLVMAGPAYSDSLLDEVSEDVKKDIEFPGTCTREKIKRYIDSCAFVCIPSFFETFGMTPLEAMARSKAVIFTTRTSGPEIIEDGKNGFLVDPDNVTMITERMSNLADDIELRNEIASNAYNTIKSTLCESRVLDKMEAFYKSIE